MSSTVTVTEAKDCIQNTKEKLEVLIKTEGTEENAYAVLCQFGRREALNDTLTSQTKAVLEVLDQAWSVSSHHVQEIVVNSILNGAKRVYQKFMKDVDLLDDLQDDGTLYPLTNRRLVTH